MRNHKNVSQESDIKSVLLPNLCLNTEKEFYFITIKDCMHLRQIA